MTGRNDVSSKVKELDGDFRDGFLTVRGYCQKKWILLQPLVPSDVLAQVLKCQAQLIANELSEDDYFTYMLDLLQRVTEENLNFSSVETSISDTVEGESSITCLASSSKGDNCFGLTGSTVAQSKRRARSCIGSKLSPHKKSCTIPIPSTSSADHTYSLGIQECLISSPTHEIDSADGVIAQELSTIRSKLSKSEASSRGKSATAQPVSQRCHICHQLLSGPDLHLYAGHPEEALEEFVALTDQHLSLFTGDEASVSECDERPLNKLTLFSVYDKEGHLCPFDSGLIEQNVFLYLSGYIKAVYEENPGPENGIPTKDLGPINEWFVSGFDGGESALIGIGTAYGEYFLMEPSETYAPFMDSVWEKMYLSKLVIEFLINNMKPSYEDLLNKLQMSVTPKGENFTEDILIRHAQFLCDQVQSFDSGSTDGELLIISPCIRTLMNLTGVTLGKRQAMRRSVHQTVGESKSGCVKATATYLVRSVLDAFVPEQCHGKGNQASRRQRCGVCEGCVMRDCGKCPSCRDMIKFGGSGRSKQACSLRRCPNLAVQEAEDSDEEEEDNFSNTREEDSENVRNWLSNISVSRKSHSIVQWIGASIGKHVDKTLYNEVRVGSLKVNVNDFVTLEPKNTILLPMIARVIYMWEEENGDKTFHAQLLIRGAETVLGKVSDPQELFLTDMCTLVPLYCITSKVMVKFYPSPSDWRALGEESVHYKNTQDKKSYYYQKHYDVHHGSFTDPPQNYVVANPIHEYPFCPSCKKLNLEDQMTTPTASEPHDIEDSDELKYEVVYWMNEEYRVGHGVYLQPGTFEFKSTKHQKEQINSDEAKDEEVYPEFYRKTKDLSKINSHSSDPFCIGYVSAIFSNSQDKEAERPIFLRVNKMYRPEDTRCGISGGYQSDLHLLFWSDEECTVNFTKVRGKCSIMFSENVQSRPTEWTAEGPHRFYFEAAYDAVSESFKEPPSIAIAIGYTGKGDRKLKDTNKTKSMPVTNAGKPISWPCVTKRLRVLDIFAGCGGLTEGLHQSGVAETFWAIEDDVAAAEAFHLNNPAAVVFCRDPNVLLKLVLNGEKVTEKGEELPQKGQVDLICGRPVCQGFSGSSHFNSRQYSRFKSSSLVSYLSFCDYYRPRFLILENVRNFAAFKSGSVLKLTLHCLLKIGYQCSFGVLQSGNYGVPQNHRRFIIMAAAPGEVLPNFPEPVHTFSADLIQQYISVDKKKFKLQNFWIGSAPLRSITVYDAIGDLPAICNGFDLNEMEYTEDEVNLTHFQQKMRGDEYRPCLQDHSCKKMPALVESRIAHIPTLPGSDWRDLPNIQVELCDGVVTNKLVYSYHDKENGKSSSGAFRGVCSCASGKPCNPMDRQHNTLIPWCLPHTGNKHNHWPGLYGRLDWDGFFSTAITNPEPMGKQGCVLHPSQTRVVSVRECARSQGFRDSFHFCGTLVNKYHQVGSAVPPPVGCALGREIARCISLPYQKVKVQML